MKSSFCLIVLHQCALTLEAADDKPSRHSFRDADQLNVSQKTTRLEWRNVGTLVKLYKVESFTSLFILCCSMLLGP